MLIELPMNMSFRVAYMHVAKRTANCALCGRTADGFVCDHQLLPVVDTYIDEKSGDTKAMSKWRRVMPYYFCCHEHKRGRRFDLMGEPLPPEIWELIVEGVQWSPEPAAEPHGYVLGPWEAA